MINHWYRWYHGTVNDPKWIVISKKTGQPVAIVLAIWAALLENASQSETRGTLDGWNAEDVAACLNVTVETVETVVAAMQGKTLHGDRLTGWKKRQPDRERNDYSTQRVQRFRERKRDETLGNVTKRLEKRRGEKKREEKKGEGNARKRATPAPESFEVTADMREFAGSLGVSDIDGATAAMLDHFRGKGETKIDWLATWRNWIRNEKKFQRNGVGKPTQTALLYPGGRPKLDQKLEDESREDLRRIAAGMKV